MKNHEDTIINLALSIIKSRLREPGQFIDSAKAACDFLVLKLAEQESEVFGVFFLDNQHRLIEYKEMFFGTIDGASIYPREVIKAALQLNAAACVFAHNHPSGTAAPSQADMRITERLSAGLDYIDVRVLDHLIVAGSEVVSFAEQGLMV